MDSKSCQLYATVLLLVCVPATYALWCPEGCNCDNENLFVNCGNEGEMNEKSNSNTVRLKVRPKSIKFVLILLSITDTRKLQNKLLTGVSEEEFKFTSIPITLNPHIKKLFVRNTSLERLDSTLQNYPYLEELRLGRNKIQVSFKCDHEKKLKMSKN